MDKSKLFSWAGTKKSFDLIFAYDPENYSPEFPSLRAVRTYSYLEDIFATNEIPLSETDKATLKKLSIELSKIN